MSASEEHSAKSLKEETPNPARMYDYLIGGHNNFEADRKAAQKVIELNPDAPLVMRANRAFLRRVVGFLARAGIEQFLDVGSGIPTAGNVHQVARKVNPDSRVLYVDSEPIAVRHASTLLAEESGVDVLQADARNPEAILDSPQLERVLDLERPTAVLCLCLFHFFSDGDEARRVVRVLGDALAAGSYLAVSHATHEDLTPEHREGIEALYSRSSNPITLRPRAEIQRFFEGFELVEPGLVYVPQWRPEGPEDLFYSEPARSVTLCGLGYKKP